MFKSFSYKFVAICAITLVSIFSAQSQEGVWYFGNGAGLHFNGTKVLPLNDGQVYTDEGSAVLVNEHGQVIMYSDGQSIWNNNHEKIKNGEGLYGNRSSAQSAIIVAKPGQFDVFYIFTIDAFDGTHGLHYSLVEGHGKHMAVTQKNTLLDASCTEKMTIVPHQNKQDFWIVTNDWKKGVFKTYHLSKAGISPAVISSSAQINQKSTGNIKGQIGYIVASNRGNKIAISYCYLNQPSVQVFDFDQTTGKLINPTILATTGATYGLCFSPSDRYLYISHLKGIIGVSQFDLATPGEPLILASNKKEDSFGGMKLGLDRRIYIAKTGSALDVIENPDEWSNETRYQKGAVSLNGKSSSYGLPVTLELCYHPLLQELGARICRDSLVLDADITNATYRWSTGETTKQIVVRHAGRYEVFIKEEGQLTPHSVSYNVKTGAPKIDIGNDTTLYCQNKFQLEVGGPGTQVLWSTGSEEKSIEVSESGKYSVIVENGNCKTSDEITVRFVNADHQFKALPSFSPDNSSFNNKFDFILGEVEDFEILVKSKRGKKIYKSKDAHERWRGKDKKGNLVKGGTYNWEVKYASSCTHEMVTQKGVVEVTFQKTDR